MSLPDKVIVFVGRTFSGHHHDYSMLKQEFPPELDWFEDIHVRVDLGYQGIQSDYKGDQIEIPTKKPRKSKKNPAPQLSDEQKAANKALTHRSLILETNTKIWKFSFQCVNDLKITPCLRLCLELWWHIGG